LLEEVSCGRVTNFGVALDGRAGGIVEEAVPKAQHHERV
jgi:hypothetical protein